LRLVPLEGELHAERTRGGHAELGLRSRGIVSTVSEMGTMLVLRSSTPDIGMVHALAPAAHRKAAKLDRICFDSTETSAALSQEIACAFNAASPGKREFRCRSPVIHRCRPLMPTQEITLLKRCGRGDTAPEARYKSRGGRG
jgi:hypothetical protein